MKWCAEFVISENNFVQSGMSLNQGAKGLEEGRHSHFNFSFLKNDKQF